MPARRQPARLVLVAPLLLGLAACQGMPGATPAVAPAAGSAPAAAAIQPRVVFFTEDSAALNGDAEAIIRTAAAQAKANPRAPVSVLGFAGPEGSVGFNKALSDARARNVADHLVEAGVERSRVTIRPRGPVPFEMMPTESRRVEIVIGG